MSEEKKGPIQFVNPDVAAAYETIRTTDPPVHLPGRKATGFKVFLSKITLEQADRLYAVPNQNLLKKKETAVSPAKVATAVKVITTEKEKDAGK